MASIVALNDDDTNLTGTSENDSINGLGGNDTLSGLGGGDAMFGGGGNDSLDGGEGDDILVGGDGDDTLIGGAGADELNGGDGIDIVSYAESGEGIEIVFDDVTGGSGFGGTAAGDTIGLDVEGGIGSAFDDTLRLSIGLPNFVYGVGARFDGGDGTDTLVIDGDIDLTNAVLENLEILELTDGASAILTAEQLLQFNEIKGSAADSTSFRLTVVMGDLTAADLSGVTLTNVTKLDNIVFVGDDDDESITGTDADDWIFSVVGNDTLDGAGGDDLIEGGSGSVGVSGSGNNLLLGGEGDDTLNGKGGDDTLIGGPGADVLIGGDIFHTVRDGESSIIAATSNNDIVSYEDSDEGVEIAFNANDSAPSSAFGFGGTAEGDQIFGVEGVIGSAHDDIIRVKFSTTLNRFDGGDGNDTLRLEDGFDFTGVVLENFEVLEVGENSAVFSAAQIVQFDEIVFSDPGVPDSFLDVFMDGTETLDLSGLTLTNPGLVEIFLVGDDDAESITGTQTFNDIAGRGGDDTLDGDAGNDFVSGGAGNDSLIGGDGNDTLVSGTGNDTLIGGAGDDSLTGGGEGRNLMIGGEGADTFDAAAGSGDIVSYEDSYVGVTVVLRGGEARRGEGGTAEGDVIGNGIDGFIGSDQDDTFISSVGNRPSFDGRGGYDRLVIERALDLSDDTIRNIEELVIKSGGTFTLSQRQASDLERITIDTGDVDAAVNITINSDGNNLVPLDLSQLEIVGLTGNDTVLVNGTTTGEEFIGTGTADRLDDINVGGGDDTYFGLGGDDRLNGDDGNDFLYGGEGNDFVRGGNGADELFGGDGDDELIGDGAEDFLNGGAGADTISGGSGIDVASYENSDAAVQIDLAQSAQTGGHAEGDALSSIEAVIGSDHADSLTGDNGKNRLVGGDGDDTLLGLGESDTLRGGAGDDSLEGGNDNDLLEGGDGDDTLDGGGGKDRLVGGAGNDLLKTGTGTGLQFNGEHNESALFGGTGDDTLMVDIDEFHFLVGGAGFDIVTYENLSSAVRVNETNRDDANPEMRNDFYFEIEEIRTTDQNDFFVGNGEDNRYQGLGGADTIDGRAGIDTAVYDQSDAGVDIDLNRFAQEGGDAEGDILRSIENLIGSDHNDRLRGNRFDNHLIGGAGDDGLNGRRGDDTLEGGDGADRLFGDVGNDLLLGGAGDDTLEGGLGQDIIEGGAGDDALRWFEGDGADTINGGEGFDRLSLFLGSAANVNLSIADQGGRTLVNGGGTTPIALDTDAERIDVLIAFINVDSDGFTFLEPVGQFLDGRATSTNLEFVGNNADDTLIGGLGTDTIDGGEGDDSLVGGANDDSLRGGDGDDTLRGGNGDDTLEGSEGDDVLTGGAGSDSVDGGDGIDTAIFAGSNAIYSFEFFAPGNELRMTHTPTGDLDIVTGVEFFQFNNNVFSLEALLADVPAVISLGEGNDDFTGFARADTIFALAGDDLVRGLDGDDSLNGGDGNDTLNGNGGKDTLVGLNGDDVLNGGDGDDQLSGVKGNDTLNGGAGNDILNGGNGDDQLSGDEGNDRLFGGNGSDTLLGGTGNDELDGFTGNDSLVGGSGNDTLTGGDGNDSLYGSAGDDTLDGGADDDLLRGGDGNDTLTGGDGSDGLDGGNGTNLLIGGDGSDRFESRGNGDTLEGGLGNDLFITHGSNAMALGGEGDDVFGLFGAGTGHVFDGGPQSDLPSFFSGDAFGYASGAVSGLVNVTFTDTDAGTDLTVSGDGFAAQALGQNVERIFLGSLQPAPEGDILTLFIDASNSALDLSVFGFGFDGNDTVIVGDGALNGFLGSGDDVVHLGAGADTVGTGDGVDTIVFAGDRSEYSFEISPSTFVDSVTVTHTATGTEDEIEDAELFQFDNGTFTFGQLSVEQSTEGNDSILGTAIDNDIFGLGGNDTLRGLGGDDSIRGDAGNDVLDAGAGEDTLDGGGGNDILIGRTGAEMLLGGSGFDTIDAGADNDTVDGGNGRDFVTLGEGDDLFIDNAQVGLNGFDTVIGGEGNDTFQGAGGNDNFLGGEGEDLLEGGVGADQLFGDADNDTLNGGDGNDFVVGGLGRDLAFLGAGDDQFADDPEGGNNGRDTVHGGAGNDSIFGGGGDDELRGDEGQDSIRGGDGADIIFDGNGFDTVDAGDGDDDVFGGFGRDLFMLGDGNDTFEDNDQSGELGRDTIDGGTGNDVIEAGAGSDSLLGGAGNDSLYAGVDGDILDGGEGDDFLFVTNGGENTLTGGDGRDVFRFFSDAVGNNVITDFELGLDIVDFIPGAGLFDTLSQEQVDARSDTSSGSLVLTLDNGAELTFANLTTSDDLFGSFGAVA